MYFKDHPLNDVDLILQEIPGEQRASVIVDFEDSGAGLEPGTKSGFFEIVLQPVRR
jgi:protocatechuate 3,4-dioxygenase beta subunit